MGKKRKEKHSIQYLEKLLIIDFEKGLLWWAKRPEIMFVREGGKLLMKPNAVNVRFNAQWAGTPAFNTPNMDGYLVGAHQEVQYYAHRIILGVHLGYWPKYSDHLNGVKHDNRLVNLRDTTQSENCKNSSPQNTIRRKGIYLENGAYVIKLTVEGKVKYFGRCNCLHSAIALRDKYAAQHGYNLERIRQEEGLDPTPE